MYCYNTIIMGELIQGKFGQDRPSKLPKEITKEYIKSTITLFVPSNMNPDTTQIGISSNKEDPWIIYILPESETKQPPTQEEIREALLMRKQVELHLVGQMPRDMLTIDYFDKGRHEDERFYPPHHHAITYKYDEKKGWRAIKGGIHFNVKDGPPPPNHPQDF